MGLRHWHFGPNWPRRSCGARTRCSTPARPISAVSVVSSWYVNASNSEALGRGDMADTTSEAMHCGYTAVGADW
jgi:hypothetical protein